MSQKAFIAAALISFMGVSAATAGGAFDRIEDRRDMRESILGEMYDRGPVDVIEDKIDRVEGHVDRAENRNKPADRIEDRRDLVESVIDEAYDRGPVDVIEDHADRREGVRDRLW